MSVLDLILGKKAAATPQPAPMGGAAAPAAGAAPAAPAPAAQPPNKINAPGITPAAGGAAPTNGFTMQLPKPGGALQPTVNGAGQPIDPATGAPLPPPEPGEQAEAQKGPQGDELALYSPGMLISGLSDRVKKASSPMFQGALDPNSPTGRTGGIPKIDAPGAVPSGGGMGNFYNTARKMILGPMLQRPKTPFGGVTGMNGRFATPVYEAADQVSQISGENNPNLGLLANWAGGLVNRFTGDEGAGSQAGALVDQGVEAWQNSRLP